LFFLRSIHEQDLNRTEVVEKWKKGERLFREFVTIETESFEISFSYPDLEGSRVISQRY
jgi:hypothetical protein